MKIISGNIGIIVPSAEGGYAGHIPEVPGCITQGETVAECREMLKDALKCWIWAATNPWISVDESLPEVGEIVDLVRLDLFISPDKHRLANYLYAGAFPRGTTHWMPLPGLPKGGAS